MYMKLPEKYIEQMKSLLSKADFFAYLNEMEKPSTKGIRFNSLKGISEDKAVSMVEGILEKVPWAEHAYYYSDSARPGNMPLHEAGLYYIQEPSAMSAVTVLDVHPGEKVLDLCAAPGGKSTQIGAKLEGKGILISNEPNAQRARILSQNIERMGIRNAVVLCEYPEKLVDNFEKYFDRILVDAPCSGEGMFRKNPEAMEEWSSEAPERCHLRQLDILEAASEMLIENGILVYSTCTFNDKENEETVYKFLEKHTEFELMPFTLPGLEKKSEGLLHLYPFEVQGEGHFLCKMRKKEKGIEKKDRKKENKPIKKKKEDAFSALPEIIPSGLEKIRIGDRIWCPPDLFDPERIRTLHCLRYGLGLAVIKGKQIEPDHALAMAMNCSQASSTQELTWEEMCAYQAGETIKREASKGYTLLHYQGISLGFGKCSDGLIKNHYPKGLRKR